jgi:hypothetical protein
MTARDRNCSLFILAMNLADHLAPAAHCISGYSAGVDHNMISQQRVCHNLMALCLKLAGHLINFTLIQAAAQHPEMDAHRLLSFFSHHNDDLL